MRKNFRISEREKLVGLPTEFSKVIDFSKLRWRLSLVSDDNYSA